MNKILLSILIGSFANCCFAQQNFEGHVVYDIYSKLIDSSSKFMDVYFKDNLVRLSMTKNPKKTYKPTEFIYDFKKGISYEINVEEQLILSDSLKKNTSLNPFNYDSISNLSKDVQGYKCVKFNNILKKMPSNHYLPNMSAWFPTEI